MTAQSALVTGYPNFVVKRLVERLTSEGQTCWVLCKSDFEEEARNHFDGNKDVRLISGDVVAMDLGLSGKEVKALRADVAMVYHLAGRYYLGTKEEKMERVNVDGTRNLLAFAAELPSLERLVHYSTAFVAGNREGVIMEDELLWPQKFRNAFESTKFKAERIVRQNMDDLPISVVRPALVVGDSRTGEIDHMDGPHFFMHVLVNLPLDIHLPLLGKGVYPLNLVPVDFVVEAMVGIARDPRAVGKTFHLVDPNPLPSRAVFEHICRAANKKPPRRSIPTNLATVLMKMPGLEKHWRSPRLFVEYLNQLVLYNWMNTLEILNNTEVMCPPFPTYVDKLVAFLKSKKR